MNIAHFKEKLEAELQLVEKELGDIGVKDKEWGWAPKAPDMDVMPPQQELTETGDKLEEMEEREEEITTLQARLSEVRHALEKIERGTYGTCEVSGEPIEEDRLEANPAARTCKAHM